MATPIPPKKRPGLSLENAVFYFSLVLFAAVTGAFFYLRSAVISDTQQLADVSVQAAKTKTAEQKILESKILIVRQKLRDFSKMLDERKIASKFFDEFEKSVLGDVYFSQCKLDVDQLAADLSGHARNFEVLSQQISIFESSSALKNIKLGEVSLNEKGGIDFELSFEVNQEAVVF